jgi:hypothetical protein
MFALRAACDIGLYRVRITKTYQTYEFESTESWDDTRRDALELIVEGLAELCQINVQYRE